MAVVVQENGLPESDESLHLNGVDDESLEDQFFESISEPASIVSRKTDVTVTRTDEVPTLSIDDFSAEERSHFQEVLKRYSQLYENEGERQEQLKKDLDSTAVREMEDNNNGKVCHCCGQTLNFLTNPGKTCAQCSSQICTKCLKNFRQGTTKMCHLCYLEDMHEGRSGKWFMKNLQESGRSPVFGTDVLRASLKRHTEVEERRRREEEERQRRAAEEAAAAEAAAAAAAALEAASMNSDSRRSSKADSKITSIGSNLQIAKKWKFGKKNKKGLGVDTPDLDSTSVAESSQSIEQPIECAVAISVASEPPEVEESKTPSPYPEMLHEERAIDVVGDEEIDVVSPSAADSDMISSMSHAVPPPGEFEEGTTITGYSVASPSVRTASQSQVPTIVVGSSDADGESWKDKPYVNEEDHIFPEDDPETDMLGLRPPSHTGSIRSGTMGSIRSGTMMSQESMFSIYSDTSAGYRLAVDVTGEIMVGLDFDFRHNVFFVKIKQGRDIAAVDTKRRKSDPYVKTYLLPDKTKISKRKTSYRKNTLCPVFDEQLKYVISKSDLETRVLSVAVWHRVAFGHNIFLGEAHIPMENYEFGDSTPVWYPLHEKKDIAIPMPLMMYKGDLILAVKYVPGADIMSVSSGRGGETKGEVHAWIKEAKNLVAARANGYSDPFCKGYLLPDKGKAGKKKTRVIRRNLNPAWNTVLRFTDVDEEDLADRCLELSIWDYGRFSSNEFLGGLRLNLGIGVCRGQHVKWMDSKGHEITMWQAMISRPNTWIEGTLMLRPNMD